MSALFRLPKLQRLAATVEGLRGRLAPGGSARGTTDRMVRRLRLDPLEERTLLSLAPGHVDDVLVNQEVNSSQFTMSGQSIAVDHDGDFVVVWTRYDELYQTDPETGEPLLDPDTGLPMPILDPETGAAMTDANVYARYFTDEVQRITLPEEVSDDNVDGSFGTFSLVYGGNEVQKLEITATYRPSLTPAYDPFDPFDPFPVYYYGQQDISGTFTLGFDLDGNGEIGSAETATIIFDETPPLGVSAAEHLKNTASTIQTALQGLGGELEDVAVEAINPHEYLINFGQASMGENQPEITVESVEFTTGFLPAVQIKTVREPIVISDIPVSPDNPKQTAHAIEQAFLGTSQNFMIGPVDFPPPDRVPLPGGPYYAPEILRTALPRVSVTARSATEFDICFGGEVRTPSTTTMKYGGDSAKKDHPELVISTVEDDMGNSLIDSEQIGVVTLKQPSPEFRVNDPEPDSPLTTLPDTYNQINPAVAMDADGDFAIVWESEVPEAVNPGSISDIFARRFSPVAYRDADDVEFVQGIRPLGNQFRVNTFTTNEQYDPDIGMDADGNFVIAWANWGQDLGYFNGIVAQRFNRDGDRLGGEWLVNGEDTSIHIEPYVGVSHDGHFAVTWSITDDPDYIVPAAYAVGVSAEVYDPAGNVLLNQFGVGGGGSSAVTFDMENSFVVTWEVVADADNIGGSSEGVRARMYELYDGSGAVTGTLIRDLFRANSADLDPDSAPLWPTWQGGAQPALDADGDLVISYDGFGPDVSEHPLPSMDVTGTLTAYLQEQINAGQNADLLPYFDPAIDVLPVYYYYGSYLLDVDGVIEEVLIGATDPYLHPDDPATDEQLGRLRAILDDAVGLVRGEGNGVMFSRWDADPQVGGLNNLFSDSVANAYRDGHNHRYVLILDSTVSTGNFVLRLWHPWRTGYEDVSIDVAERDGVLLPYDTADNIEGALEAATRTGVNWPERWWGGPIAVRVLNYGYGYVGYGSELEARQGTPWEITDMGLPVDLDDYVFEITFQGEIHDEEFLEYDLVVQGSGLQTANIDEQQILTFSPMGPLPLQGQFMLSNGTNQTNPITFDSTDLAGTAAAIQNALENDLGFQGVVVTAPMWGPPYDFTVDFQGNSGQTDQPPLQYVPVPDPNTGQPMLNAQVSSTTTQDGGSQGDAPWPDLELHTLGDRGTEQTFASIGMEPDGDFVLAWTQFDRHTSDAALGTYANTNIYFRTFNENTDTAGPLVTDFLLPDGTRLRDGGQVNQALQFLVVSFDEQMTEEGIHSVTDPRNWALMRDGAEVVDGIHSIHFGMNMASELATAYGLDVPGSNKWEAVLVLDGNGASAGITPLLDGHYEIVAKNSLRDLPGNPLGRNGFNINGASINRDFDVLVPTGSEILVNGDTAGGQITRSTPPDAPTPQSVASDSDGDFVIAWSSDADPATGEGQEGVFVKMYDVTWFETDGERDSVVTEMMVIDPETNLPWPNNDIRVTDEPTASFASVARDADGDFVVTWSAYTSATNWDVYFRRYDAAGNPLDPAPRMVNSETDDIQRYSTVAMDADGDFVITWQSLNQDGGGYGIYAQRYDPAGDPIGGVDEVQVLSFEGRPVGTFQLRWVGDPDFPDVSDTIVYEGNPFAIVDAVQAALEGLGAEVEVTAISGSEIVIRFVGVDGSRNQPQIAVVNPMMVGEPGARVTLATRIEGAPGEFRVNDTTENNQRFPSIAMAAEGDFVITWTSAGQDGDAAYETNIYAKRFVRNEVIRGSGSRQTAQPGAWAPPVAGAQRETWIVTVDSPGNHVVAPGSGYDGVVMVNLDGVWNGSGAMLVTGNHVLTAAHVVADLAGNLATTDVSVTFNLPSGDVTLQASQVFIHPNYNGDPFQGYDVAVIVLEQVAPALVERYDIYRDRDEMTQVGPKYGYGLSGTGDVGSVLPGGTKRTGQNKWEAFGGILGVSDALMVYDFDNGLAANDAFGQLFGINDLGLGNNEVCGAPGDSGGPTFLSGAIAGVVTGGISVPGPHDVLPGINSSFGDFGLDTRISEYSDWIDEVTQGGTPEFPVNQTIANDQKWSTVSLDADGDFVITWTSYGQDGVGTGYGAGAGGLEGIYARRYDPAGAPLSGEFQVNTFAEQDQQHSHVALDADGDFVVAWESFQDRPQPPFDGPDAPNSFGIYAQQFARSQLLGVSPFLGANGEMGSELGINATTRGDQRYPGATIDDAGDFMIVWSGYGEVPGQADDQGVFLQRYTKPADTAGPIVADVFNAFYTDTAIHLQQVLEGSVLESSVSQFVVTFGENLSTEEGIYGLDSVLNTNNWTLSRDGVPIFGGVAEVQFGLNQAYLSGLDDLPSNKYEAVLTFDADPLEPGIQSLGRGVYVLTARDSIQDIFGNDLDGDFDGAPGGDFHRTFTIFVGTTGPEGPGDPDADEDDDPLNDNEIGNQDSPAVASNADGDHVVVWVTYGESGDALTEGNILAQRYDAFGQPVGSEFVVNSHLQGSQLEPDIAMDVFGNFVVTWSGAGPVDDSGVFARIFDAFGVPQTDQFRVNQFRESVQDSPTVGMDANGDFVVSWTSYGQDGDRDGVYARRYNFLGDALDDEFRVNSTWRNRQENSDVALDADGNFVVIWTSDGQDGSGWGIYGQRYAADGTTRGAEFRVNAHTDDKQLNPQVAMDTDGDYVVTWQSFLQDGSGYGIYARRYGPAGAPKDNADFLVNETTQHWQITPAVDMDDDGNFVITWSTFDQDDEDVRDYGIYARMFLADGSDYIDPATDSPQGEFRVNATTLGDQITPAIAVDADGDFVVVWVGPDSDGTGVFGRVVGVNTGIFDPNDPNSPYYPPDPNDPYDPGGPGPQPQGPTALLVTGTPGDDVFEFIAGPTPTSWVVRLNGQVQDVSPHVVSVTFDGRDGRDTATLIGTEEGETAELWPGQGVLEGGDYTVTVAKTEAITVQGLGGEDLVTFHDSKQDDLFGASPRGAGMIGQDMDNRALGFESVLAYATGGGHDEAKLYDSPGEDTLVTTPTYARLYGDGFSLQAEFFDAVHTFATSGGFDVAKMFDSKGDDTFYTGVVEGALFGEGFYNRAKFFDQVHAYATAGGFDTGSLIDSAGDDVFYGSPVQSSLYGEGFYFRAKHFEEVRGYAVAGGHDEAQLYDGQTDDQFVATPQYAALYGEGFYNWVKDFEDVYAYADKGGFDVAKLFDSPGNDTYVSTPTYTAVYGEGFYNRANRFEQAHAYATSAGFDVAKMFDSVGDDVFYASPIESALYNAGFYNRAKHFEQVHAYATAGGVDEARMYDSSGDDTFVGRSGQGALFGEGFYNRAKHFEKIQAHADAGGTDTALLYDAALERGFHASGGLGGSFPQIAWLYDFEECFTQDESDEQPVQQAVDEILTAYWP